MNASTSMSSNFLNISAKPHDCKIRAVIKFLKAENVPTAEIFVEYVQCMVNKISCLCVMCTSGCNNSKRGVPKFTTMKEPVDRQMR